MPKCLEMYIQYLCEMTKHKAFMVSRLLEWWTKYGKLHVRILFLLKHRQCLSYLKICQVVLYLLLISDEADTMVWNNFLKM